MYKAVIFDLDGTLTESGEGIIKSVKYALEKLGIPDVDPGDLLCFVGPPLVKSFMKFYNLNREKADLGVKYYRERFSKTGIYENRLYPGIKDMLTELKEKGYILAIASSKPEEYIHQVLDHFEISSYFDNVTGSFMTGKRSEKSELIEECLSCIAMQNDREHAVFVGDRENDVQGALEAGIDCIAVLYGYGSRKELEKAGASHIIGTVEELRDFLIREYDGPDRCPCPGQTQTAPGSSEDTENVFPENNNPPSESGETGFRENTDPSSEYGDYPLTERLKRQLDFSLEIDKEKNVFRQTHLSGHGRKENDAEHAWHMAIMSYLLREYANEDVDISRVMIMCLIHDIVEIDAGDTYAYDKEGISTQKEREDAAKERIFSILPEDQRRELTALFDEFEACETADSKFAHAMDNLQPLLLNNSNRGGDWREHGISAGQVYERQRKTRLGSEQLYRVIDSLIQKNVREGNLLP